MNEEMPEAGVEATKNLDQPRGRSTIEFPYLDLSNAVEVAHAIKAVGGTSADWAQLAVKLQMSSDGGGFRLRMMAGKAFGILDYDRGHVQLTALGTRVVDPLLERPAKVEAFMKVPLFRVLFEKLNGQILPPSQAIERMAEQAGVAPKQKDKARQVFIRSAKQAGMFDLSPDRMATPSGLNGHSGAPKTVNTGIDVNSPPPTPTPSEALPPFIKGLLEKLPKPDTEWPIEGRAKWLMTAANIFDLMYLTPTGTAGKSIDVTITEPPKATGGVL